jgi:outer membrane protein assembly factor BamB
MAGMRMLVRLFQAVMIATLLSVSGCALPWTTTGASYPRPSPTPESALARRTVYWSQGNHLWAFRASDGQVRWKMDAWSGLVPNSSAIYTIGPGMPTLINDTLYATAIDGEYATPELYAIDPHSGAIRWRAALLNCLQYTAPVVQDGVIYLTTSGHFTGSLPCERNGYVLALRASDGALLWRAALEQTISNVPVITNGILTVVSDNYPAEPAATYLNAFRASDGARLWRERVGLRNVSLAGDAGTILVTTDALDGPHPQRFIEAYQASDGRQLWTTTINSIYDPLAGATMANGMIYLDPGGDLMALRASDGKIMWSFAEGVRGFSSPLLLDGRLYVGIGSELLTFDASGGALLNSYDLLEPYEDSDLMAYIWSRPTIMNGTIFVSAAIQPTTCCPGVGGVLYGLDVQSGRLFWSHTEQSGSAWSAPVSD